MEYKNSFDIYDNLENKDLVEKKFVWNGQRDERLFNFSINTAKNLVDQQNPQKDLYEISAGFAIYKILSNYLKK